MAWFYLLRVPIVIAVAVALLGLFAKGNALFQNLLVMDDWRQVYWSSLLAFLLAATLITTANLTLYYGPRRFRLRPACKTGTHNLGVFAAGLVPAAILVGAFIRLTRPPASDVAPLAAGAGVALGFATMAAVVIGLTLAALWLARASTTPEPGGGEIPFLVFPLETIPPLKRLLLWAYYTESPLPEWFARRWARFDERAARLLGRGYSVESARGPVLGSGHVFAAMLWLASLALYWTGGAFQERVLRSDAPPAPPLLDFSTLAFVLLALILACWTFGGLAFYLDRFRVPFLWLAALYCLFTSSSRLSDHFYATTPADAAQFPLPAPQVALTEPPAGRVVVAAAAGGGIQAAAWTAKVLSELRAIDGFAPAVRLISGASGGSVGAMFFLRTYPHAAPGHRAWTAADAAEAAMQPCLDDVAWGLVNPDLWRVLLPWARDREVSRGWALERSFAKRAGLGKATLLEWSRGVGKGFPAVIFNATAVEYGVPALFSTTAFPPPHTAFPPPQKPGSAPAMRNGFYLTAEPRDVAVATAVRLSAAFPYVSPVSRQDPGDARQATLHLADGGYYDNYGLVSLMGWLLAAAENMKEIPEILVLRIESFPPEADKPLAPKGWAYQTIAPLETLLNVRTGAQLLRNNTELELLSTTPPLRDKIAQVTARYAIPEGCPSNPPLSWKLNKQEQECIREAWRHFQQGPEYAQIRTFLGSAAGTGARGGALK
ncbi:MAG: patatin-like phospholipase family protein [Bryobacteraceae bacterium]|nr:patatin-like phospholipase family protein [Bryobacteraceae bacterium]